MGALPDIDMIENMDCDDIMDDGDLAGGPGGSLLDVFDFTPTKQNLHKSVLPDIGDPMDIENVLGQEKQSTSFTADFSDMSDDEEETQVKLPWQSIMNTLDD